MSFELAQAYLREKGFEDRIRRFEVSSATVELAAKAVGVEEARIAKSLTFLVGGAPVMVICAGDAKVNNSKFKAEFHQKAVMLTREEVKRFTGHEVGGVCPFGIPSDVRVLLDVSLRRFDTVYPACGDAASAVRLSPEELYALSGAEKWADVCLE